MAGTRLVVMSGCGHNPMGEAPSAFNDLVVRLLGTGGVDVDSAVD